MSTYDDILSKIIPLPAVEGPSKVSTVHDAVRRFIRPGMAIHSGQASVRWPTAILYEIARQFWGTSPGFTLIALGMNHPTAVFVHGRLAKKLILTYCGDSYPTPGPNAAFQRAFRDKTIEFENWSILTLSLRLKAAAMGLSFLPTRSLVGSTMAQDNQDAYKEMDDPFSNEGKIGVVKALYPDISILHGAVADPFGNTIFLPPNVENVYGAMAGRSGAIITVERIVSTDFIRRHSHLVILPGQYVISVSEVPFGGHPSKHPQQGLEGFEGYGEDYEFIVDARAAAKTEETLQEWIEKWVLGCSDHQDYLRKVGSERLLYLNGKIQESSWEVEFRDLKQGLWETKAYTPEEMAIVAASRMIRRKVEEAHYQNILCGAGMANLAGWLAFYGLRDQGIHIEIMAEAGMFGYAPRPGDPATFNTRNFPSCKLLTDVHHIMGILMGGAKNRCIGSLGAGQIDRFGNINTTADPEKGVYMVGSGGANDIASSAQEIVVTAIQGKRGFVEEVPYITSPGKRVRTIVSTMAVFERPEEEFIMTGVFREPRYDTLDSAIRHVQAHCGWEIKVHPQVDWVPPPSIEELRLLRVFDPHRHFLGRG